MFKLCDFYFNVKTVAGVWVLKSVKSKCAHLDFIGQSASNKIGIVSCKCMCVDVSLVLFGIVYTFLYLLSIKIGRLDWKRKKLKVGFP